ncbi:MAG: hypothetical protein HND44_00725 [Chloroflexi bacterium]|nr:hypothetical protein [Ardenticatenaceae bacterium]NOG33085.1 hypothetical protein [Chloroflexota bacterium]
MRQSVCVAKSASASLTQARVMPWLSPAMAAWPSGNWSLVRRTGWPHYEPFQVA